MRRRLFEDLVLSGGATRQRGPWRGLRFSLALHGAVVAGLAALSMSAVSELPVRAAPVHLPLIERPSGVRTTIVRRPPTRAVNAGHRPISVDDPPPPAIGTNVPVLDADLAADDTPTGNGPLCLSGCVPGDDAGSSGDAVGTGPTGTGGGEAPLRPVGGDIREPRRIAGPLPVYPDPARRAHIEGKVILECVIDVDGHVTDLKVVSGHPLFNDAALDAVRRWVYTPTTLNGRPVRVIMTVTVKFGLER